MRTSSSYRLGDSGQRVGPVDQHLEFTAWARRWVAVCPEHSVARRLQLIEPTGAPKAAAMMGADRRLETLADAGVYAVEQAFGHGLSLWPVECAPRIDHARCGPPKRGIRMAAFNRCPRTRP